jgi:mercuric ion binding protein
MKAIKFIAFSIVLGLASCESKNETATEVASKTETHNGETTSTFKVWGNCEMCKETIEGSLKADGIIKADWNVDSKIMTVVYEESKISLDQIQKKIAAVGYDNEKYKGDDKAYNELAGCCQYDRK